MNNQNESSEAKTKNIAVGSVSRWVISIILLVGGFGMLFSSFIAGLATLLAGVIIFPPANKYVKEKYNFSPSRGMKILAVLVLLVISGSTLGESESKPVADSTATAPTSVSDNTDAPVVPLTLEQQVTNKINEALGAINNTDKPTVVKVEIDTYNAAELKAYGYKSTDDVKRLLITINASENLTTNLQKGAMAGEAADIFQSAFPLSSQIGDIIIWSQLPTKDQYGNTKDDTAITYAMGRPLFEKMNWTDYNHRDLPALLNNEEKVDDRNGSRELLKF